jgi:glycosyltransferase involved in cell wall biosynthesis
MLKSFCLDQPMENGVILMHRQSVTVVIPAYNEEATVGGVISDTISIMETMNLPYEIVVVDDGSNDATALIASNQKVMMLSNEKNQGKGYSIKKGIQHTNGEIIVTLDSDGEHKPKEIPDLLASTFNGADIVAGSRFMGNQKEVTTRVNRIGNFLFNTAISALTGVRVTDSQTGFRAFKREVINRLDLESDGFEIETEITVKGLINGYAFKELPISCKRNKNRISKLNLLTDGTRILKTILKAAFLTVEKTQ